MKTLRLAILLLPFGLATLTTSCAAQVDSSGDISLRLPERLFCAAPPQDIKARLWISGMSSPCLLDVDSSGQVSGSCPGVTARARRSTTLDYYLQQDLSARFPTLDNPYTILLAQAHKDIDLNEVEGDSYALNFSDADFVSESACLDFEHINADGDLGRSIVDDFGETGSPCDLDADMSNSTGGSNLQELCTGHDPFVVDTP